MRLDDFLISKNRVSTLEQQASTNKLFSSLVTNRNYLGTNISDDIVFRLTSSLGAIFNSGVIPFYKMQEGNNFAPGISNTLASAVTSFLTGLGINTFHVAGGTFRSMFFGEVPRDIDIFIDSSQCLVDLSIILNIEMAISNVNSEFNTDLFSLDSVNQFSTGFTKDQNTTSNWTKLNGETLNFLSEQSRAENMFSSDPYCLDERLSKVFKSFTVSVKDFPFKLQFIFLSIIDTLKEGAVRKISTVKNIVDTFDFACIGFGTTYSLDENNTFSLPYSVNLKSVYVHPSFISSNVSKTLIPIYSGLNFRSCSLLRLEKYIKNYGYSLSPEALKYYSLILAVDSNANNS